MRNDPFGWLAQDGVYSQMSARKRNNAFATSWPTRLCFDYLPRTIRTAASSAAPRSAMSTSTSIEWGTVFRKTPAENHAEDANTKRSKLPPPGVSTIPSQVKCRGDDGERTADHRRRRIQLWLRFYYETHANLLAFAHAKTGPEVRVVEHRSMRTINLVG